MLGHNTDIPNINPVPRASRRDGPFEGGGGLGSFFSKFYVEQILEQAIAHLRKSCTTQKIAQPHSFPQLNHGLSHIPKNVNLSARNRK